MIAVNLSRAELELLVKATEIAGLTGWPTGDDRIRGRYWGSNLRKRLHTCGRKAGRAEDRPRKA